MQPIFFIDNYTSVAYNIFMKTIKELRQKTGLSQSQFARKFHLSVRTLQQWEQNRRETPEYVIYMISRILELEDRLCNNQEDI